MTAAPVSVLVCRRCGGSDFGALNEALRAASLPAPARVAETECMNGCARPVSLALQSPGRATYFFSGVDPAADAADIVATVRAYLAAPAGWIEDARGCGRLRFALVGRVPALSSGS